MQNTITEVDHGFGGEGLLAVPPLSGSEGLGVSWENRKSKIESGYNKCKEKSALNAAEGIYLPQRKCYESCSGVSMVGTFFRIGPGLSAEAE